MNEDYFNNKYKADPFYLFARDVVGAEMKKGPIPAGFELLKELEEFFKAAGHLRKAQNVVDFRNKWKEELKEEFKN